LPPSERRRLWARTVLALALPIAVAVSCCGGPEITLEQAGSRWYTGVEHSVYVCVRDEASISEVTVEYGVRGQQPTNSIEMSPFTSLSVSIACDYYRATIPPEHVRQGLYLEVSAKNERGDVSSVRTDPVITPLQSVGADPALNLEEFGVDVSPAARIPTIFGGPTSGLPTDFGYGFPGALWVPVELSYYGEYELLTELNDRGSRQNVYEDVLTHLFVQDHLGSWALGQQTSDQSILDLIESTAEAGGLELGEWDVLTESFGAARRLTRVEMDAWLVFLNSESGFTRSQAKWARIHESFGTIETILRSVDLSGDGLRAVFLMQLMIDAAQDRVELFERTRIGASDMDQSLVDAIEAVKRSLEAFDRELMRAVLSVTDPVEWHEVTIWELLPRMTGIGALRFALDGSENIEPFRDGVEDELDSLLRLVLAATLERALGGQLSDEAILGQAALELAQMQFYLGYYYSSLFLSIRGDLAPELLDGVIEAADSSTVLGTPSLDTALDVLSSVLPKPLLEAAYANGSGVKHFLVMSAGTPWVDMVDVTAFIDLDDYFGVTGEGKDGWVTTIVTVSVSAGVSLLPFDVGIWKLDLDDAPGGCPDPQFEASAELVNLTAVYKVTGAQAGPDGHEIAQVDTDTAVANVSFSLAGMTTASLNVEVRREAFDHALLQAIPGAGQLISSILLVDAVLDAILSLPSSGLPSLPIREATCADSGLTSPQGDSIGRLAQVNAYCAMRHAEYEDLLSFTAPIPEGSLTLQEAAALGYIRLESKGGYSGDSVTLIATGANEEDVTVVARPGDVLLVKGEQGLKQSLVVSSYDTTLIRGDTPPGTVLKRGIYTFCINADAGGLHEGDRFDVTLNLADWPYESAQQLLMLLTAIEEGLLHDDAAAQDAVWAISNGYSPGPEAEALLRRAGVSVGSSLAAFPALLTNPAADGSDTEFVIAPELRSCSLFLVAFVCALTVLILTLLGIAVVARSRA